jgi:hypothetical protein
MPTNRHDSFRQGCYHLPVGFDSVEALASWPIHGGVFQEVGKGSFGEELGAGAQDVVAMAGRRISSARQAFPNDSRSRCDCVCTGRGWCDGGGKEPEHPQADRSKRNEQYVTTRTRLDIIISLRWPNDCTYSNHYQNHHRRISCQKRYGQSSPWPHKSRFRKEHCSSHQACQVDSDTQDHHDESRSS